MLVAIEKVQEEISKRYSIPEAYRDDIMQDIALIVTKDGPNNIDVESIMNKILNKYSTTKSIFKVRHTHPNITSDIYLAFSVLTLHEEFTIKLKYGFNIEGIMYHNAYIAKCLSCTISEVEEYEKSALMKLKNNSKLLYYFQSLNK